jgi:hypothetical protein
MFIEANAERFSDLPGPVSGERIDNDYILCKFLQTFDATLDMYLFIIGENDNSNVITHNIYSHLCKSWNALSLDNFDSEYKNNGTLCQWNKDWQQAGAPNLLPLA